MVAFEGNGMHGLIKERLEKYVLGAPHKKVPLEVEQHLRECAACREEVNGMQEHSQMLRVLGAPKDQDLDPSPGFYARVLERIETQQTAPVWSVLLDPIFTRRLVATSLALAVLLGGYLAYTEAGAAPPMNAESIMAVQEHPPGLGQDRQRDRDITLVTLATYHE